MKKMLKEDHFPHSSHGSYEPQLELPSGAIARLGQGMVEDLTFSVGDQYLAVAARTGLWWYSLTSMSPTALWETERGMVSTISRSADGRWFAAGNLNGILKLWDIQSGLCVRQIGVQNDVVTTIRHTFSLDGKWFAIFLRGKDTVYIVNPEVPAQFTTLGDGRPLKNRRSAIKPLAFSVDSRLLASVSPTEDMSADFVSVWELETKKRIAYFMDYPDCVYGLDFSSCGRFLSVGCWGGVIRIWDIFTGKLEMAQTHYGKYRMYPCYSSEGKLLAAGFYQYDNTNPINIWDVENQEKLDEIKTRASVSCARFSESGTRLAVASGDEIKVWTSEKSGVHISSSIREHTEVVESVVFFLDGKRLAAEYQSAPHRLWNLTNFRSQYFPTAHQVDPPHVIHSLPSEKIYYASQNDEGIFKILDPRTTKCLMEWTAPENPLWRTVRLTPRTDLLVIGYRDGTLIVWKIESGKRRYTFTTHTDSIISTAFSPDGSRLASTSSDKTIRFWDVRNGKGIGLLSDQHSSVIKIVFSPCGRFLAGGLFGEIRFWDATTYDIQMIIRLPEGCQRPYALTFSPCGHYLASGSWWQETDRVSIRLWDVTTGDNIATFWGHPTDVQDLAFSPDGGTLASASFDGTILLWDVKPYLLRYETS